MKKHNTMRILVIAAVLLTLLGAIFIGVGIAQGGSLRYLHVGKDTASWWPFRGTFGIGYVDHDEHKDWTEGNGDSWERTLSGKEKLSLDIAIGDIVFQEGKKQEIRFQDINEEDVTIKEEQRTTKVHIKQQGDFLGNHHQKVIVTMPADAYKKIEIDSRMGDVTMRNLQVDNLDIEVKMGDIELHNMTSKALEIENKAGDIEVSGNLLGRSKIENKMGDITVTAAGKQSDYYTHVQTQMGDTRVGKRSYELHCDVRQGDETSVNQIHVEAKMGDVELNFN